MVNEPATMEALRRVIDGDVPVAKAEEANNGGVTSFCGRTGAVELLASDLREKIFQVGDLFITMKSTSPANRFGGTWERLEDVFLYAVASGDAGGKSGSLSKTLNLNNVPSHSHYYTPSGILTSDGGGAITGKNGSFFIPAGSSGGLSFTGVFSSSTTKTDPNSGSSGTNGNALTSIRINTHTHTFTGVRKTTETTGGGLPPVPLDITPVHTNVFAWRRIA